MEAVLFKPKQTWTQLQFRFGIIQWILSYDECWLPISTYISILTIEYHYLNWFGSLYDCVYSSLIIKCSDLTLSLALFWVWVPHMKSKWQFKHTLFTMLLVLIFHSVTVKLGVSVWLKVFFSCVKQVVGGLWTTYNEKRIKTVQKIDLTWVIKSVFIMRTTIV